MRSFLRNRRFKNFAFKTDVLCSCLLLNSKPGKNIISIAGCTAAQTSLSNYLKGKTAKVTFFAFYSLTENPFSFNQGFCIAFNSSGIMQDNLFVLVGISRDGNKIETKQMNIK